MQDARCRHRDEYGHLISKYLTRGVCSRSTARVPTVPSMYYVFITYKRLFTSIEPVCPIDEIRLSKINKPRGKDQRLMWPSSYPGRAPRIQRADRNVCPRATLRNIRARDAHGVPFEYRAAIWICDELGVLDSGRDWEPCARLVG